MCTYADKISYHSIKAATQGALRVLAKHDSPQRPYECDCGQYHLTTQAKWGGRNLTAERVHYLAAAHLDTQRNVVRPIKQRRRGASTV